MKAQTIQIQKPKRTYKLSTVKRRTIDVYAAFVAAHLKEVFGHNLENCEHQNLIDYIELVYFEKLGVSDFHIKRRYI